MALEFLLDSRRAQPRLVVVEQVASLESVGILELAATAVGLGAAQAAESAAKLRLVLPARRVEAA